MVKGGLYQIAFYFVNDSFRSTACLQYPADTVAVAVIRMALKHKGIEISKCKTLREKEEAEALAKGLPPPVQRPWFEELFHKDKAVLDAIANLIAHVLDGAEPVDHEVHVPPPPVVAAAQAMAERALERRRRNLAPNGSNGNSMIETKSTSPNKRPREHRSLSGGAAVVANSVLTSSVTCSCSASIASSCACSLASSSITSSSSSASCSSKCSSSAMMEQPAAKLARVGEHQQRTATVAIEGPVKLTDERPAAAKQAGAFAADVPPPPLSV